MDRRSVKDRRKQPTTFWDQFSVIGKRKEFRRSGEVKGGGYVDRYGAHLLFVLTFITGLNLLDALFTMAVLDLGAIEINPVVVSVMNLCGDKFWIWKFGIVSFSIVLLCLHSQFRRVKCAIVSICLVYLAVVLYEIVMMIYP